MALADLKQLDPGLEIIRTGDGNVMVSNRFQGRVLCEVDGRLLHRFVVDLARNPHPDEFNNIGGNSLWPAPEGGAFAFNYPPDGDWMVQPGINSVCTTTVSRDASSVTVAKDIVLGNRAGCKLDVHFERRVAGEERRYKDMQGIAYATHDTLSVPAGIPAGRALMSAWSLEQFPGAEGIVAFGFCSRDAKSAINDDFYGNPWPRLAFKDGFFAFRLGGDNRLQIGISASMEPQWIGAWSPSNNTVVIRRTEHRSDGRYFNIADNAQPNGPFSAGDQFSIFNGSRELDFHELETIAPVVVENGELRSSFLDSHTEIYVGSPERLRDFVTGTIGVPAELLGRD